MKWFFATNEESLTQDPQWFELIKVAVLSAKKNTSLEPHMIYEGGNLNLSELEWIRDQGVVIHYHKLSFGEMFKETFWSKGAYLRTELVQILKKENIRDKFVLYTDCDVIFLKDPKLENIRPEYFAVCPEFDNENYSDMNTGVMLMNVDKLQKTFPEFLEFMKSKKFVFDSHDQGAYKEFYKNKWAWLPLEYNWRSYWGINPGAKILHFHGTKHTQYEGILKKAKDVSKHYILLAHMDLGAFHYYVRKARKFLFTHRTKNKINKAIGQIGLKIKKFSPRIYKLIGGKN